MKSPSSFNNPWIPLFIFSLSQSGADTGGCIGAYAPPGHSRECWCTPCGSGIKSELIEIHNSFQYNLIKIDISNIFYKYFRALKDPGSHFCAEDNFSASAGGAKKNHRGCKKKITGGARILQGVHEKKNPAPPGQMSVSAPGTAHIFT